MLRVILLAHFIFGVVIAFHSVQMKSISVLRGTSKTWKSLQQCRIGCTLHMIESGSVPLRSPAFRGQFHDRQWSLNIENFRGKWSGTTYWYERQEGKLDLSIPTREVLGESFQHSFPDAETGRWEGFGSYFTNGTKILELSRETYNRNGMCFQFPGQDGLGGIGGQGSTVFSRWADANTKYIQEINFFNQRTRSMIIIVYTIHGLPDAPQLLLNSVGVFPFRCQLGCEVGTRQRIESVDSLMKELRGWKGQRLSFGPQTPLDERRQTCGDFDPAPFTSSPISACLPDNLVLSAPETIEERPFELTFGCLQTRDLFKQLTVSFDATGSVVRWTFDEYRPAGLT